jgi:hypothetical protein
MSLTKDIQKAVGIMCLDRGHELVVENINLQFCRTKICSKEVDLLSISKSGVVFEFEVKISRSDYAADLRKFKHDYFQRGKDNCINYFSFVCPKDMLVINDLPNYAGLYYYDNDTIIEVKRPQQITNFKHDIQPIKDKFIRVMSERSFYGESKLSRMNKANSASYNKDENQRLRDEVFKLKQQAKEAIK